VLQEFLHIAAAQQAHHQIGHAGITPVVVERHNMRMFQPRHQLRLGLKAANEVGVIGILRQNDLDGDFTLDQRLRGAIHCAESSCADFIVQQVAAYRTTAEIFESDFFRRDLRGERAFGRAVAGLHRPCLPHEFGALVEWNGERLFQAAKFGTEMQYQHLVFEEFARTIQPNIDIFIPNFQNYQTEIDPSIVAEFAHTVYRFGHSMLTETIDRLDPNFQSSEIGLIQAFLNPLAFAASGPTPDEAAGAIVRGVTRQVGNAIDEFVTEALRNNLLGLPLDLPAINLARGRDAGIPSLNAARREFYAGTGDSQLKPYTSWADFAQNLKHPESLINFIAAYGTHETVTAATTLADKRAAATLLVLGGDGAPADRLDFLNSTGAYASLANGVTTTGLDAVDLWIGGLAEKIMPFGGMLGSTFNFVFETQLEALQNGDRLYYLHRFAGTDFLAELENNSFSKLVMLNTDATHLPALMFQDASDH